MFRLHAKKIFSKYDKICVFEKNLHKNYNREKKSRAEWTGISVLFSKSMPWLVRISIGSFFNLCTCFFYKHIKIQWLDSDMLKATQNMGWKYTYDMLILSAKIINFNSCQNPWKYMWRSLSFSKVVGWRLKTCNFTKNDRRNQNLVKQLRWSF